jgi:hypothetical protein
MGTHEGESAMYRMLCLTIAAIIIAFASFPTSARAQIAPAQIKLTDKQIKGFIAAQDDILAVVEKMQDALPAEYESELDSVSKKHGFRNLADYDTVASNISIVTAAIDPRTKVFTDPQTAIKKEIDDVHTAKTISEHEKRHLLEELNAALKATESIRFPTNIALVKKYYDKLATTTVGNFDLDTRSSSSLMSTSSE